MKKECNAYEKREANNWNRMMNMMKLMKMSIYHEILRLMRKRKTMKNAEGAALTHIIEQ